YRDGSGDRRSCCGRSMNAPRPLTRADLLCQANFIAGEWRPAGDLGRLAVNDSATEIAFAEVPDSGPANAIDAVNGAREEFQVCAHGRPASERSAPLGTGMVGINEGALASEAAPSGGQKESGY